MGDMVKMNGIIKLFEVLIRVLLPNKLSIGILNRMKRTKNILLSTIELRLFFKVILFPIILLSSLIIAVIKILLIWMLPYKMYNDIKYIVKQFYMDIAILKNVSLKKALKRACLLYELFTKGYEKKISPGELNPNITFYVIRPYYFLEPNDLILSNVANLLTQYYYCLQKLSYAVEKGYIPVVDWENYGRLPHSEDYPINGSNNSWEYYWQQPSEYELTEVYNSKNVILSTQNIGQFGYIPNCAMKPPFNVYAKNIIKNCPRYAKLIPLNRVTEDYVEKNYNLLFPKEGKVLGVIIRGSSYGKKGTQFSSHPMQIGIKELIKEIKKTLEAWEYDYIFFVNEVQEIVDIIKKEFGDRVIILPRMRDSISRPTDGSVLNPMYEDGQRYKTNLDYVTEIALLSKCDSIIGSMSSGTRTALIWNGGEYEHVYIFEKGLW